MSVDLRDLLRSELAAADLPATAPDDRPVGDDDLAALPPIVQRYLSFMEVPGRPRDWSFRARIRGRFRLRPRMGWMPSDAWQYDSGPAVARIYVMRLRFARVLPMVGVDRYVAGRGRMHGTLLGRITVADGEGEEIDTGELTTFLNDGVLIAPSMLLRPEVTWSAVDDSTFEVSLTDRGRTVSGTVTVDGDGAPRDFVTTDRFADLPGGMVRAEWHTPVEEWGRIDGRRLPTRFGATWHLPDGPLPYVEGSLVPGTVAFNVPPT